MLFQSETFWIGEQCLLFTSSEAPYFPLLVSRAESLDRRTAPGGFLSRTLCGPRTAVNSSSAAPEPRSGRHTPVSGCSPHQTTR